MCWRLASKLGTPKFQKAREELILTRLDARPKKIPPPEETPARRHLADTRLAGTRPVGTRLVGTAGTAMARKSM